MRSSKISLVIVSFALICISACATAIFKSPANRAVANANSCHAYRGSAFGYNELLTQVLQSTKMICNQQIDGEFGRKFGDNSGPSIYDLCGNSIDRVKGVYLTAMGLSQCEYGSAMSYRGIGVITDENILKAISVRELAAYMNENQ